MVPWELEAAMLVAYVFLLGGVAVAYRVGRIDRNRFTLLIGTCLAWLAYLVLQITDGDPIEVEGTAEYAIGGLSLVLLVVGIALLYRSWRERNRGAEAAV